MMLGAAVGLIILWPLLWRIGRCARSTRRRLRPAASQSPIRPKSARTRTPPSWRTGRRMLVAICLTPLVLGVAGAWLLGALHAWPPLTLSELRHSVLMYFAFTGAGAVMIGLVMTFVWLGSSGYEYYDDPTLPPPPPENPPRPQAYYSNRR